MYENEDQVTQQVMDEVTADQTQPGEMLEQPTEPQQSPAQKPPKTFTQEEVDEIVRRRNARTEAKLRREFESKFGSLEAVLKAGTGEEDLGKITDSLRQHYEKGGVKLPQQPSYTDSDVAVLAAADAEEIIAGGYEDVVEEAERLAKKGVANMTAREKATYNALAEYRQRVERSRELQKIGVTEQEISSPEFRAFAAKFGSGTPVTEVYDIYKKLHPAPAAEPIGSMKNGNHEVAKTYYSPEEVDKLTPKDYENPAVMKAVRESMKRWK